MFNIGPAELLIIGLVLLIAVGPEQLPGVIRRAGSTVAQLRSMTDGLRSEFMAGLDEIERATDVERWSSDVDDVGDGLDDDDDLDDVDDEDDLDDEDDDPVDDLVDHPEDRAAIDSEADGPSPNGSGPASAGTGPSDRAATTTTTTTGGDDEEGSA